VTIVFVSLALLVGRGQAEEGVTLAVGQPAPETLTATRGVAVVDRVATEQAREVARTNTPDVLKIDPKVAPRVAVNLNLLFAFIEDNAFDRTVTPVGDEPIPDVTPTTAAPEQDSTTTTEAPATTETPTSTVAPGEDGGEETTTTTTTSTTTTTTEPPTTTTTLPLRSVGDQIGDARDRFPVYADDLPSFVVQFNLDVDRRENGEREVFPDLRDAVLEQASAQMEAGIRPAELQAIQNSLISAPFPVIFAPGLVGEQLMAMRETVANIVAETLQANEFADAVLTSDAEEANAADVQQVTVQFFAEDVIALEGQRITEVELEAINKLQLLQPEESTSRRAVIALGGMAVLLAAFFLWRVAPNQWSQPRHFALLGVLLLLAAATTRIPELIVTEDNTSIAYILPAVMFGYMGAILYDPRTAVLLAIPVSTFTAISTADPALTIFAAGATVVPVAFVSAVSSRRQLRVAVGLAAIVLAPFAASVAWLFTGSDEAASAALFGFVGGVVGGLIAQGILSFLETTFRMTTTLTLLDLTDRNHPALRLLEEKAPGTFNHSILVGTLAGKAARAIGANPLLAQAAAYYHDLGKTENPQYFIENQFGFSNPHDDIEPIQSAEIIRNHVTDGLRLANRFRIPDEIVAGIRMHHGTGLMRYFYHQALEADASIDPADFRHGGEKPKRQEMAILMISDAVEGAARSLAQQEDPTSSSLAKMVDSVVGEKLEDGQLDESALTFGDLTKVKQALVDALVGYYHTRIPYPDFPGAAAAGNAG